MSRFFAGIALVGWLTWCGSASAQEYFFTRIADSGSFIELGEPVLNNAGVVVFRGTSSTIGEGIFRGSGGALTTLYDTSGNLAGFSFVPDLNESGQVAFLATRDDNSQAILRGNGGPLTTIADSSAFQTLGVPSLNNAGAVAFYGNAVGVGGDGIYVGSGGAAAQPVADESGDLATFEQTACQINNSGAVAFWARRDDNMTGLFVASGGAVTPAALESSGMNGFDVGALSLNDSGRVGFFARLSGGGFGFFTVLSGTVFPLAAVTPAPELIPPPVIGLNNVGNAAFGGNHPSGGPRGAFIGSDPIGERIIAIGDALDGSVVVALSFARGGWNDNGALAFRATLLDGRVAIYRADATGAPAPNPNPGMCTGPMCGCGMGGLCAMFSAAWCGFALRRRS